jgi:hypothetical protein
MKIAALVFALLLVPCAIYMVRHFRERQMRRDLQQEADDYGVSEEVAEFLVAARDEYNLKQGSFHKKWLSNYDRYDIDTPALQLVLTKGDMLTVFDVQSMGSVCKTDSTWQWAWDNPNVPEYASRATSELKAVGAKYRLGYLQEGHFPLMNELTPWFLGGFALKVSKMDAIFVAQAGEMEYYFLIANPRVRSADQKEDLH